MPRSSSLLIRLSSGIIFALLLTSCPQQPSQLELIQSRNIIHIALLVSPPLYFHDDSVLQGYGYKMVADYASAIGVEMQVIPTRTIDEIVTLLKQGKVHIGIAGSVPSHPDTKLQASSVYDMTQWYVVGNQANRLPKSMADIAPSKVVVAAGSGAALVLRTLKDQDPKLNTLTLLNDSTQNILKQIHLNQFKVSITDEYTYTYYRNLYPEIKMAFALPDQYPRYWLTYKLPDQSLINSIDQFIRKYKEEQHLYRDDYFSHLDTFDYVDNYYYLRRIETTLPQYMGYFKTAAQQHGFDTRLLAAVSYQESHWDADASSPTKVRGLMMLTKDTAKRVGVTDRLAPDQSVMGGAKYLSILRNSLPDRINEPDRSWFMLAAYNIGLGHLEDARVITQSLGDDPDVWLDVKKHLPKLRQKKWYKKTKYGYARGNEAITFVNRVRRYYDILRLYDQQNLLEQPETETVDMIHTPKL